jgi:ribosomal protein S18 acetylase RimI-like enzyme
MFEVVVVAKADTESLVPILRDAEEGDDRIRAVLGDPQAAAYAARDGGELVGAAVVRAGEIVYIAVAAASRRRGYGRRLIEALKVHHPGRLVVGTANCALDNIAFYQRCGFRMLRIERDFFDYIDPPIAEYGIPMRDMIIFSYDS